MAWIDIRVKYAVAIETVATEWGSIKINQAILIAATDAIAIELPPKPRPSIELEATDV